MNEDNLYNTSTVNEDGSMTFNIRKYRSIDWVTVKFPVIKKSVEPKTLTEQIDNHIKDYQLLGVSVVDKSDHEVLTTINGDTGNVQYGIGVGKSAIHEQIQTHLDVMTQSMNVELIEDTATQCTASMQQIFNQQHLATQTSVKAVSPMWQDVSQEEIDALVLTIKEKSNVAKMTSLFDIQPSSIDPLDAVIKDGIALGEQSDREYFDNKSKQLLRQQKGRALRKPEPVELGEVADSTYFHDRDVDLLYPTKIDCVHKPTTLDAVVDVKYFNDKVDLALSKIQPLKVGEMSDELYHKGVAAYSTAVQQYAAINPSSADSCGGDNPPLSEDDTFNPTATILKMKNEIESALGEGFIGTVADPSGGMSYAPYIPPHVPHIPQIHPTGVMPFGGAVEDIPIDLGRATQDSVFSSNLCQEIDMDIINKLT